MIARLHTIRSVIDTALHRLRYRLDTIEEIKASTSGNRPRYIGIVARNHRRWGGWSVSSLMVRVWRVDNAV